MTSTMFAARAIHFSTDDPLSGLAVDESSAQPVPEGWIAVTVKAAALNRHDLWTLQGVGMRQEQLPIILGCDAAGMTDDGREVIVHSVIGDPEAGGGDETLDPRRTLLSEKHDGTFAERVWVPARNVIPKPPEFSWEQASCLPTAWLTAYRMLFTRARLEPGSTVLVQGAGGGVATALIALGSAAGYRIWVTSRHANKREYALQLGADAAYEVGVRLPERVDAVMETVGKATWSASLKALRPGGTLVIAGATTGADPPADLAQIFFLQRSVLGSTMGTLEELRKLLRFCVTAGIRPTIDAVFPLSEARAGFQRMMDDDVKGKIVFVP
jgi:NADPH:quinone reductase-like Zn-dependent oxidoreductase